MIPTVAFRNSFILIDDIVLSFLYWSGVYEFDQLILWWKYRRRHSLFQDQSKVKLTVLARLPVVNSGK